MLGDVNAQRLGDTLDYPGVDPETARRNLLSGLHEPTIFYRLPNIISEVGPVLSTKSFSLGSMPLGYTLYMCIFNPLKIAEYAENKSAGTLVTGETHGLHQCPWVRTHSQVRLSSPILSSIGGL